MRKSVLAVGLLVCVALTPAGAWQNPSASTAENSRVTSGTNCEGITSPIRFKYVNYAQQVQPVFDLNCAPCHISGASAQLSLTAANSYRQLVGVNSFEVPAIKRVQPGEPDNSYLFSKINCDTPQSGDRMPQGGPALSPAQQALINDWIAIGAPMMSSGFE
jgi:hypothetical protein